MRPFTFIPYILTALIALLACVAGVAAQDPAIYSFPRVEVRHEGLRRVGEVVKTVNSIIQSYPALKAAIQDLKKRSPDLEKAF